jgi:hypothetical protein
MDQYGVITVTKKSLVLHSSTHTALEWFYLMVESSTTDKLMEQLQQVKFAKLLLALLTTIWT